MFNKYRTLFGILIGLLIASVAPLALVITKITAGRINLLSVIYALNMPFGLLAGSILTGFLIMFFAGTVAAAISSNRPIFSALSVGILTPIIGHLITSGGLSFDPVGLFKVTFLITGIATTTFYALLGGFFYKFILRKIRR